MLRPLKRVRNVRAQAVVSEYALVIVIMLGMIMSMTIYVKRALQARVRDTQHAMMKTVRDRTRGYYSGNIAAQYEPYYVNRYGTTERDAYEKETLTAGGSTGIWRKFFNHMIKVESRSQTAPPKDAY